MAFLEEHCASVALVHVEVDHQDALYSCRVVAQCHARRHADVWLGLGVGLRVTVGPVYVPAEHLEVLAAAVREACPLHR